VVFWSGAQNSKPDFSEFDETPNLPLALGPDGDELCGQCSEFPAPPVSGPCFQGQNFRSLPWVRRYAPAVFRMWPGRLPENRAWQCSGAG